MSEKTTTVTITQKQRNALADLVNYAWTDEEQDFMWHTTTEGHEPEHHIYRSLQILDELLCGEMAQRRFESVQLSYDELTKVAGALLSKAEMFTSDNPNRAAYANLGLKIIDRWLQNERSTGFLGSLRINLIEVRDGQIPGLD